MTTNSPRHTPRWRDFFPSFFTSRFVYEKLSCVYVVRLMHVENFYIPDLNCWWLQLCCEKSSKKNIFQPTTRTAAQRACNVHSEIFPWLTLRFAVVLLTFYYVQNSIAQPIKFVTKLSSMPTWNAEISLRLTIQQKIFSSLRVKSAWKLFSSSKWDKIPLKFYHNFTLHGCHSSKNSFPCLVVYFHTILCRLSTCILRAIRGSENFCVRCLVQLTVFIASSLERDCWCVGGQESRRRQCFWIIVCYVL